MVDDFDVRPGIQVYRYLFKMHAFRTQNMWVDCVKMCGFVNRPKCTMYNGLFFGSLFICVLCLDYISGREPSVFMCIVHIHMAWLVWHGIQIYGYSLI